MNTYAILVAGGKGLRMGTDLPKQFLTLAGKPVLMHTLEAFQKADASTVLILVLPMNQQAFWADLCVRHGFKVPHRLADGGVTRFDSVRNGLEKVEDNGLIAVHDGVRPLVSAELIRRCFQAAASEGAVVPVHEVSESLRKVEGKGSRAVDRSLYRAVQTPQTFQSDILRKAYEQDYRGTFTDDAAVVEAAGYHISLVEGIPENIKITTPLDLLLAEQLLKR
jgi:2-C-methyl-D-erythritol 4-phosphate cytidylyltransferase